jgi:predicted nucleic acid-binding protein
LSVFADSSAVVPAYAPERGRKFVDNLENVTVSELAAVEVLSALWGKHRRGELSRDRAASLVQLVQVDLYGSPAQPARFTVVPLASEVLREAARLVEPHALAAGDAIQLACAVATRRADPDADTFACFDRRLRAAAAAERFAVVP